MKVKQLVDKILKDWAIILICFIAAVFIYGFHQSTLTEKRTFVIPVEISQNGNLMISSYRTDKVTVSVRSSAENVAQIHSNMIKAYLNIDNLTKSGEYTLPVIVIPNEELLAMDPFEITVKPENIKIHVEDKTSKYLRIDPVLVGEPEYGFEITEISVDPKFVRAEGPSSVLMSQLSLKTTMVDISDKRSSFETEINSDVLNRLVKLENNGPYKVNVKIDYISEERTYENVPIRGLNLAADLEIEGEMPSGSLTLYGRKLTLENYKLSDNALNVDLRYITEPGNYELPVNYVISSLYSLRSKSFDTIPVVIKKREIVKPEISDQLEDSPLEIIDFSESETVDEITEVF